MSNKILLYIFEATFSKLILTSALAFPLCPKLHKKAVPNTSIERELDTLCITAYFGEQERCKNSWQGETLRMKTKQASIAALKERGDEEEGK